MRTSAWIGNCCPWHCFHIWNGWQLHSEVVRILIDLANLLSNESNSLISKWNSDRIKQPALCLRSIIHLPLHNWWRACQEQGKVKIHWCVVDLEHFPQPANWLGSAPEYWMYLHCNEWTWVDALQHRVAWFLQTIGHEVIWRIMMLEIERFSYFLATVFPSNVVAIHPCFQLVICGAHARGQQQVAALCQRHFDLSSQRTQLQAGHSTVDEVCTIEIPWYFHFHLSNPPNCKQKSLTGWIYETQKTKGHFVFAPKSPTCGKMPGSTCSGHCLAQCIVCHTNGHQRRGTLAMPHHLPIQQTFRTRPQQAVSTVKVGPRKPSTCAKREPELLFTGKESSIKTAPMHFTNSLDLTHFSHE